MTEEVRAEIVARALHVHTSAGQDVSKGDTLLVLESMKLEIPVLAESAGTVVNVPVRAGSMVREGDLLAVTG